VKTSALILIICCFYATAFGAICPFCNERVIENQSVFETENFRVLIDYKPRVKGHLLAIPKRHVEKAHELNEDEWRELSLIFPAVFKVFEEFLKTDQYMVLEKNGPQAYQEIPHVHFHLIPVHGQHWKEIFDIPLRQLSPEELKREADLFRAYFQAVNVSQ
jgi:histidine triad (HIT) family protein